MENIKFSPIIVIMLALMVIALEIFQHGTKMDGVISAQLSKNLANGEGTLWALHSTKTHAATFYEHPSLKHKLEDFSEFEVWAP